MSASPDAIVLDVTSTFAGRKALLQLRANAATLCSPILILTAGAVATSEAAGYAGAYAHCTKPCMPVEFVKRLNAILLADTK
jgi:DNA-binding response OmpR family regulator